MEIAKNTEKYVYSIQRWSMAVSKLLAKSRDQEMEIVAVEYVYSSYFIFHDAQSHIIT
jgi:hypothetical protein